MTLLSHLLCEFATPNPALHRTAPAVTLAVSDATFLPAMQPERQPPPQLSLGSQGVVSGMRILTTLILLIGLLPACAAGRYPIVKNSFTVPMPKRTPFASDPRLRAEYLMGYRTGYVASSSGTMVVRHYEPGYQLNAEQRGFSAGNADGFLTHLNKDLDRLKANTAKLPDTK